MRTSDGRLVSLPGIFCTSLEGETQPLPPHELKAQGRKCNWSGSLAGVAWVVVTDSCSAAAVAVGGDPGRVIWRRIGDVPRPVATWRRWSMSII